MKSSLKTALTTLEAAMQKAPLLKETLSGIGATIASRYYILGSLLPKDHAWTWGKGKDSFDACQFVDELVKPYGLGAATVALLELLAFSADIGRLIVQYENQNGDMSRTQATHGAASAELLSTLNRSYSGRVWKGALIAVERHSAKDNPTLEMVEGDEVALILCNLLRDIDMTGIYVGKGKRYVESAEEMARQIVSNKLNHDKCVTADSIETFEKGRAIDSAAGKTYPDMMLRVLAWGYNYSYEETWGMVIASGAPKVILKYIRDSLLSIGDSAMWTRVETTARERLNIEV